MKVSRESAEHYKWGDNCDGWHLVKGPEISIIHERMPANTEEEEHCHEFSTQFFFILKGEALMVLDDEEIVLKPGEGVEIKPFQYHQMKNVSEYEVEFLVYSTPPAKGDRKYKNEL